MASLTKADLTEDIFNEVGLNKREAKDVVDNFFEEIILDLEQGYKGKFSGFGNFNLRDKDERPGRNPKTGEETPVSKRRVVTFKASRKLKNLVEEGMRDKDGKV